MRLGLWVAVTVMMASLAFGQGVVGVWSEPSIPKRPGHADPQRLANLLRRHGFSVKPVSSRDLANPQALTPQKLALVILPYGAYFPADAVENFRRYLKAGGKFISLGATLLMRFGRAKSPPSRKSGAKGAGKKSPTRRCK